MDETLVQLIKAMQDIAPQVWNIYMKQVTVELFQFGVPAAVLCFVLATVVLMVRKGWEDLDELSQPLSVAITFMLALLVFLLIGEVVGRIVNPEYYAIQMLLEVMSGN